MKSLIEVSTSGSQVYQLMGLKNGSNNIDWLKCTVNFDGTVNANANTRYWAVTDHYSDGDKPWSVGVPALSDDSTQDWERTEDPTGELNYTECPPLEKCIF